MVVNSSFSTVANGVRSAFRRAANSAGCSIEQIFSPVSISADYSSPTPGFRSPAGSERENGPFGINVGIKAMGPTIAELDPYYPKIFDNSGQAFLSNSDYNMVVNSGIDANLKKNPAAPTQVRTQGFRGPLILSGWGFDLNNHPVPSAEAGQFDPNMAFNRAYWKTGPVDLKWDEERQVWSGGSQVVWGYALTNPSSPLFIMKVMTGISVLDGVEDDTTIVVDSNKAYGATSFYWREERDKGKVFVIAMRVGYTWRAIHIEPQRHEHTYLARYTGGWGKGEAKTISNTDNFRKEEEEEHIVLNLFSNNLAEDGWCMYTRVDGSNSVVPAEGQSFYLIAAECNTTSALSSGET
jgi:hypothetical protein